MSVVKRIVCLANSRKTGGRCIAGREYAAPGPGQWIRPVWDSPTEELPTYHCRYSDGAGVRVLDIVDVPLIEFRPRDYQRENWVVDPQRCWVKRGVISGTQLRGLQSAPEQLWINGGGTSTGLNDRMSFDVASNLKNSLRFIGITDLKLKVFAPGEPFGNPRRRVQAWFTYFGTKYGIWVTDSLVEPQYLAKRDGEYAVGRAYVTVSLGEAHKGECYKLAAAVISKI